MPQPEYPVDQRQIMLISGRYAYLVTCSILLHMLLLSTPVLSLTNTLLAPHLSLLSPPTHLHFCLTPLLFPPSRGIFR